MAKIFLFLMISNAQKSSKGGKRIEAVLPMNQLTHMLVAAGFLAKHQGVRDA